MLNLNGGNGVEISGIGGQGASNVTLRAPFPKISLEGLYANEITFEGGIPDWDWSKVELYVVNFANTVKMSQLNNIFDTAGYIYDLRLNDIDRDVDPTFLNFRDTSVTGVTFTDAAPKDIQLEFLKSGAFCTYGTDFSNDDLSNVSMAGTVLKANETALVQAPRENEFADISNIIIRDNNTQIAGNYKSTASIGTVDCTQVSGLNKDNIPAAKNYIVTEAQFSQLSSDIMDNYDGVNYHMRTPTITVKTATGNVVYKLIETPDENGDHCNYTTMQSVSLRWEKQ